jgi:hypothetical protein
VYEFTCYFKGDLYCCGREAIGQPEQTFIATVEKISESDGWRCQVGRLEYPGPGVWRLIFFTEKDYIAAQTILIGSTDAIELTEEERMALRE